MDLPALFSLFDSVFTEKRFRTQKYKEVVSFAKSADGAGHFEGGYLFTGSRHMYRPLIFMGVYVCQQRVVLHFSCQCKLRIPTSLQASAHDFFNSQNRSSKGLWCVFADNSLRFSSAHLLPSTELKLLIWLLIQRTDTWFKASVVEFVEWMKRDTGFRRSVAVYQEEFTYFARVMPKDTVQEVLYKDMSDLAQHQLKNLGFTKYSTMEKYGKIDIVFTLTNEGTSTGISWKMFPVILTLGPALLEIKIVFMMNEQWIQFSDPEQVDCLCGIIAFVNSKIAFGYFNYDSEKKYVYLYAKSTYCLMDKKDFGTNMERALAVCISNYKTYAYGFVEMVGKAPSEEIFQKCLAREQYFRQREILKSRKKEEEAAVEEEEEENESESSDAATDEYSETSSDGSEREEEKQETVLPSVPISSFDQTNVDFIRRELPSSLQKWFCLDAADIEKWKIVHWKREDRISNTDCICCIVNAFVTLRKNGLEFSTIPFDSAAINNKSEFRLLPTFPVSSMKLWGEQERKAMDEEKLRFEIHAELLQHLSCSVAKGSHLTLASLKVFRTMQDIDYIPVEKFKNRNLVDVETIIGNGGFGTIYRNEMNGVEVALKSIKPERAAKRPSREYLKAEFKLMQACTHRNVVHVYGYTKYDDQILLVLEYCPNGGLNRYLHSNPTVPLKQRVRILAEIANGMTLVHAKSVCHFDLKPQNILLSADLTPKICDFGLSQIWNPDRPFKKVGLTMMYAAPEQICKQAPGLPADVWAFGILAYYTVFGRHPFDYIRERFGKTDADREGIYKEISGRRRKPLFTKEFETQHPQLVHLIRSCTNYDPLLRPTFKSIVLDIEEIRRRLP